FELFEELIVEEEDPDVPVGDQIEGVAVAVRMGVGAHQAVVHAGEVGFVPDEAATGLLCVEHAHLSCPSRAVLPGTLQIWVDSGWIWHIEVRHREWLHGEMITRWG